MCRMTRDYASFLKSVCIEDPQNKVRFYTYSHPRYVCLPKQEKGEDDGCQQIRDRQGDQGCPHVIRLLVGPARQQVDGEMDEVSRQHEGGVTPPENIHDGRDQGHDGHAQIGQPGLSVAHGREPEAVEQGADADGREHRQDNSTEDGLELQHKQRCMADGHFCHRKAFPYIVGGKAAKGQNTCPQKHGSHDQTHGQRDVLQVVTHVGGHHEPFFLQVAGYECQQNDTVEHVVADL